MVAKLTDIDEQVLLHVGRYRLTTPTILAESPASECRDAETARTLLMDLVSRGWLAHGKLVPGPVPGDDFFHLSRRAAKHLGHDAEFSATPRQEARQELYAVARFCCASKGRVLFTKSEFQDKFRSLWFPGQPVRYYIEPPRDGTVARLAFIKVDKDGAGRWDRLIDSCARFLAQRTTLGRVDPKFHTHVAAFQKLVQEGKFQITILTALEDKKRSIELELDCRREAGTAVPPIAVHVVPGFFELIFPHGADRVARAE